MKMFELKKLHEISWHLPDRFEYFLFILAFIFFAIFDYAQNRYQTYGFTFSDKSFLGFTLASTFWVFLFLYLLVIAIGVIRSLLRRGTYFFWDMSIAIFMLLGVYFMAAGGIAAMYLGANDPVAWFFNIPQITMYHVFGVLFQIIGGLWFFTTD